MDHGINKTLENLRLQKKETEDGDLDTNSNTFDINNQRNHKKDQRRESGTGTQTARQGKARTDPPHAGVT